MNAKTGLYGQNTRLFWHIITATDTSGKENQKTPPQTVLFSDLRGFIQITYINTSWQKTSGKTGKK